MHLRKTKWIYRRIGDRHDHAVLINNPAWLKTHRLEAELIMVHWTVNMQEVPSKSADSAGSEKGRPKPGWFGLCGNAVVGTVGLLGIMKSNSFIIHNRDSEADLGFFSGGQWRTQGHREYEPPRWEKENFVYDFAYIWGNFWMWRGMSPIRRETMSKICADCSKWTTILELTNV